MAQRRRKSKRTSGAKANPASNGSGPAPSPRAANRDTMKRGYAKAEVKNQAAREALEPIAPGERPPVLIAAVVWCLLIAAGMVYSVIAASGENANGARLGNGLTLLLILVAVVGSLRLKYWAILGVQTILALSIVIGLVALTALTKEWLLPLAIAQPLVSGVLFYKMVKVMARVQKTDILRREQQAAGEQ